MSTQPNHIKEAVHAAVVKIESAHLRWQSRLRPPQPLRIPSASAAMVPLLVAEIRAGRGPKLYVCTQAEAVDLALAMVAHHSRVPMEHLLEGDVRERDFPLITAACGRIAASQMTIIRVNRAKELQSHLASVPADMLTLSDVPVVDDEAQVIRGLAAARRLTLILFASNLVLPTRRYS